MNLCKDCKHGPKPIHMLALSAALPNCQHPLAPVDPVFGWKNTSCSTMRATNCLVFPACGKNGDWFEEAPPRPVIEDKPYGLPPDEPKAEEPKKTVWQRIFSR